MSESELAHLHSQVQQLRRKYRQQRWLLVLLLAALTGVTVIGLGGPSSVMAAKKNNTDKDGVLHVRGLVVEDESGHERVRLGAPLPDPMIHGVRQKRKGPISGVLISDANGNERGGYVTSDTSGEAFLSLDSEDEQQVLFLANPKGGVNFDIYDSKGNEAQVIVFPSGPKFTMRKQKETIAELPLTAR